MMKFFLSVIFVLSFLIPQAFAQDQNTIFSEYEDSLASLFNSMYEFDGERFVKSDIEKDSLNAQIHLIFEELLNEPGSFGYVFTKLKHLGILASDDNLLRIYTWNLQYRDHSYRYFGFLQYVDKGSDEYFVYRLTDKSEELNNPENQSLTHENWYGALYYDLLTRKDGNKTIYTVLGWDGTSDLINRKIIDAIEFNRDNEPEFGVDAFRVNSDRRKRIIFEFSSKVSMMLRYDVEKDIIVFDHLAPSQPKYTGKWQYYGPDLTHDAFQFEKGKWYFVSDVIMTNKEVSKKSGRLFRPESNNFYR